MDKKIVQNGHKNSSNGHKNSSNGHKNSSNGHKNSWNEHKNSHPVGNIVFLQVEIVSSEGMDTIQGTVRSIMRRLGSRELWSSISFRGIRQSW